MRKILDYLNTLTLRAYVALQVFAHTEPVRLRAALLSAVAFASFTIPALADADVAQSVASIATVALPILVGESTRSKVSPTAK
jgi:hypothetical protein